MEYEESLLRVPLEGLHRATRLEVRRLEKEWGVVFKALGTLSDREEKGEGQGAEAVGRSLEKIEGKLRGMKRKMQDAAHEQDAVFEVCHRRARLVHDTPHRPIDIDASQKFFGLATHRMVCDYALYRGYLDTAQTLADEVSISEQVDIKVMSALCPLTEALQRGDAKPALAWCGENRSKLSKNGSTIELKLRMRDCVEVAETQGTPPALELCRKHVAPLVGSDPQLLAKLRRLVGYLTFRSCGERWRERYADVADPAGRKALSAEFASEYLCASCVSEMPLLLPMLQAGVLCLNTGRQGGVVEAPKGGVSADPMSDPSMQLLASGLPAFTRKNSALVCRITGRVMDDTNPPMATPTGHVYSQHAVRQLVAASQDKRFVCPKTGIAYRPSELHKVYVM